MALTWLARAMPLKAADSKFDPNNQSPQIPALPWGSKIHGIPGVLVGRAAPLHVQRETWILIIAEQSLAQA